jgi:hypothetical protein
MAEFLDWLITDPSQPNGGWMAQAFGQLFGNGSDGSTSASTQALATNPAAYDPTLATYGSSAGLLGNSPLGNILRRGFAGMAGSTGYTGLGALAAGAQGASKYDQQRLASNTDLAQKQLNYQRQRVLLGLTPRTFANMSPNLSGSPINAAPSASTIPSGATAGTAQAPLDPTNQGGQPESQQDYRAPNQPTPPAVAPQRAEQAAPTEPNLDPAFYEATNGNFRNPGEMYQYGYYRSLLGDPKGKDFMDQALQFARR